MERTIGLRPVREFAEPRVPPQYQPFRRGPLALSYDPYYVAPTTETTTTETTTTDDDADEDDADGHRGSEDTDPAVRRAVAVAGGRGCSRPRRRGLRPCLATRLAARADGTAGTSRAPPRSSSSS